MHETIEQALSYIGEFKEDWQVRLIRDDIKDGSQQTRREGLIELTEYLVDGLMKELPEQGRSSRAWQLVWRLYQDEIIKESDLDEPLGWLSEYDVYVRRYRVGCIITTSYESNFEIIFDVEVKANSEVEATTRVNEMKGKIIGELASDWDDGDLIFDPLHDLEDLGWDVESEDIPEIRLVRRVGDSPGR